MRGGLKLQTIFVYILIPMKTRILIPLSWFVSLSNLGHNEILWVSIQR